MQLYQCPRGGLLLRIVNAFRRIDLSEICAGGNGKGQSAYKHSLLQPLYEIQVHSFNIFPYTQK